jgi:transposase
MKPYVSDALWERLQPLLPPPPQRRFRFPGRKRLDYRQILTGILFVLKTGIAWDDLPADLGCGCGKTCRRYLQVWHAAGVWRQLHAVLLGRTQRRRSARLVASTDRRLLRQGPGRW